MASDLRRPVQSGEWYSKTPAQWKALDQQGQRTYTNIGRIEETSDGQLNPDACERCTTRGLICKSYTARAQNQFHQLSKKCSHCIAAHRSCVLQQLDTRTTHKRKAQDAFDVDDDDTDKGDASRLSAAGEHESHEVLERGDESDDQSTAHLNMTERKSSSKSSKLRQPLGSVRHSTKNATTIPQAATGERQDNGVHVLDLKKEVIACLDDGPLHVVSSAKWANHQLAMMARLEALEKEVRRMKRKEHEA